MVGDSLRLMKSCRHSELTDNEPKIVHSVLTPLACPF